MTFKQKCQQEGVYRAAQWLRFGRGLKDVTAALCILRWSYIGQVRPVDGVWKP